MAVYERYTETVRVVLPYRDKVILCLETAANFGGYSNMTSVETAFRVFATEPLPDSGLTVEVISEECFASKETIEIDGILCTGRLQTILDLLEYGDDVCIQCLCETMSNYYYENGETWGSLVDDLSDKQRAVFYKWEQDAIDYYTED